MAGAHGPLEADAAAIVDAVRTTIGIDDEVRVEHWIAIVLGTLRERLADDEAEALARGLPERFRKRLLDGDYLWDYGVDELVHRIAMRTALALAEARRLVEAVATAVAEHAATDDLAQATRHLPEDWTELLAVTEPAEPRPSRPSLSS